MLRSKLCTKSLSRREMLRLCCAASLSSATQISAAQARSADLARRLREAARTGAAVRLPPGEISLMGLELPDGAALIGAPGRTVLKLAGLGPLLTATMARKITLENLVLDGAGAVVPREKGLVDAADVLEFNMHGCTVRRSESRGVDMLRSGGTVSQCVIEDVGDCAFFSFDGLGVDFDNNQVRRCGDNGVLAWTKVAGTYDGARIRNNVIEDIHNRSGGNGPYGNGVSVYGGHSVRVENNRIRRCAYTHVRNNAAVNCEVVGNDCVNCGERSMYAEFGAKNSTFRNNRIEDVGSGIGVANPERGTDGAIVEGNTIIKMTERHPDADFSPEMLWMTGVDGEKNVQILGNTISGGWIGVALGGPHENVRVEGNTIADVDYGVLFFVFDGGGASSITRNRIRGARKASIAASHPGFTWLPGDLAKPGAPKYAGIAIAGNDAD